MSILKKYTTHIWNSAATSKASQLNVDLTELLKKDCWKNSKTFFIFYKKDIVYYAREDAHFMSIFTWNIYVHMLFIFTCMIAKTICIWYYIRLACYICLTCRIHIFNYSIKKVWVKILGFEVSFNQLTDKVKRNLKLSDYLPSVKLD